MQVEISEGLLRIIRGVAEKQERSEEEVLEEAMRLYLRGLEIAQRSSIGAEIPVTGTETVGGEPSRDPFLALLDRMRGRFDFDDPDEAMRIAVEEQHAARRERRERAER